MKRRQSTLVDSATKQTIDQTNPCYIGIYYTVAQIYVSFPDSNSWEKRCEGYLVLSCDIQNITFINLYDYITKELIFQHELYENFPTSFKPLSKDNVFYTFCSDNSIIGISFISQSEAKDFEKQICNAAPTRSIFGRTKNRLLVSAPKDSQHVAGIHYDKSSQLKLTGSYLAHSQELEKVLKCRGISIEQVKNNPSLEEEVIQAIFELLNSDVDTTVPQECTTDLNKPVQRECIKQTEPNKTELNKPETKAQTKVQNDHPCPHKTSSHRKNIKSCTLVPEILVDLPNGDTVRVPAPPLIIPPRPSGPPPGYDEKENNKFTEFDIEFEEEEDYEVEFDEDDIEQAIADAPPPNTPPPPPNQARIRAQTLATNNRLSYSEEDSDLIEQAIAEAPPPDVPPPPPPKNKPSIAESDSEPSEDILPSPVKSKHVKAPSYSSAIIPDSTREKKERTNSDVCPIRKPISERAASTFEVDQLDTYSELQARLQKRKEDHPELE